LLRTRYPESDGWVLVPQVANGTGYSVRRHADAIAMHMWPSRGLELHGFECKSAANDLRRELETPEKADVIATRCDYWWVVLSRDITLTTAYRNDLAQRIPNVWGILAPDEDGKLLKVHRPATKFEGAVPVDRSFMAAVLRAHQKYDPSEGARRKDEAEIAEAVNAAVREQVREVRRERQVECDRCRVQRAADEAGLRGRIDELGTALGVPLGHLLFGSAAFGSLRSVAMMQRMAAHLSRGDFRNKLQGLSRGLAGLESVVEVLREVERCLDSDEVQQ
jgi:hypothetical protein